MFAKSTVIDNWQVFVVFFIHAKQLHALSFIVIRTHSITRMKFFCRLEMPMLISTYSHTRKAMIQITERLVSTKELLAQMTTAFFAPAPLF